MGIDYLARKVTALLCHSNFLTAFDHDLWQALILKRSFSEKSGMYNASLLYAALCGLSCMFSSQV